MSYKKAREVGQSLHELVEREKLETAPLDHLSPHGDPVLHSSHKGAQAGHGLLGAAGHVLSDVGHAVAGAGGPSGGTGEESLSEVVTHVKPVEDSEALRAGQAHHEQPLMRGPGA